MNRLAWTVVLLLSCAAAEAQSIESKTLQTVTLSFSGPETSESAPLNPFTDYRLLVTLTNGDESVTLRGFYAADGNAAETGAESGSIWQCRFATEIAGRWSYQASLRRGEWIAISDNAGAGEEVEIAESSGRILVSPWPEAADEHARDFRRRGRVAKSGHHYRLTGTGDPFLKMGANSPENLLAYVDFDDTYRMAASQRSGEAKASQELHRYEPHFGDWRPGDPVWRGGKGKSLIGAINYLAAAGMNSIYFLTMNIGGDGKDVWPYVEPTDFTRFDCSKLDQWEIVFEHMQSRGMLMHVITQETENETLLDDGDTGRHRRLYYRELIARFAHHPAVIWNLGEENGPANFSPVGQSTAQQQAMSDYFKAHDPYQNTVLVHSHAALNAQEHILLPLLGHPTLDGVSLQVSQPERVHSDVVKWRQKSTTAGQPWAISMDEIGPADRGAVTDQDDPRHDDLRGPVLWGSLMGGASGVEWYFGYKFDHNDLGMEDWRSRQTLWDQTRIAKEFFQNHLPFSEMEPRDPLIQGGDAYCFAKANEVYAVYRFAGQGDAELSLDLSGHKGEFDVDWFDPVGGGDLKKGSVRQISGGKAAQLGTPPGDRKQDWVALVRRAD